MSILAIRFVCQRNLFSSFITIECYCVCSVMVCFILNRCHSDRVISCVCSIYSYRFTSCVFYVVTGNVYFVSCASIAVLVTCLRCNLSDICICRTCYISFRFHFFSRSSCRCYIINVYCIDCFLTTVNRIFCDRSNLRSIFTANFYSIVQFAFRIIGQVNSYVAARCSCFDVLAIVSANYAKAQATSLVQFLKISSACVTSQTNCVIETVVYDFQLFFSSGTTFFSEIRCIQRYVS